jgi:broad specificity phosphatase PhoE
MPPDGGTKSFLILRHGETSWNRECRIMGTESVALSEAGRAQCAMAARLLSNFSIDTIVSSPLLRARESADLIADSLGVEVREDGDLEEVRFGGWQGMTYEEVMRDPAYAAYAADPCGVPTPGGETILDVQARGLRALSRATADRRTLFVSHGDIIRSVMCHYLAIPAADYRRIRIDNCGLSGVDDHGATTEVKFVNTLADPERVWEPLHWGPSKWGVEAKMP